MNPTGPEPGSGGRAAFGSLSRAAAGWTLVRPGDVILAVAGAALSAYLAAGGDWHWALRGGFACGFALAGANVHAEWLHREKYRLARPFNPLAQKAVKADEAKWLAVAFIMLGVALGATMGVRAAAAATVLAAVMLCFNAFYTFQPGGANIRAAAAVGLPVWFAPAAWGAGWHAVAAPAAAAAALALSASFFQDVHTREADEIIRRPTLARASAAGAVVVGGVLGLAAAATMAAAAWAAGATVYLSVAAAIGLVVVVYAAACLRRRPPDADLAGSTARMVKFLVFVSYAAAAAARVLG